MSATWISFCLALLIVAAAPSASASTPQVGTKERDVHPEIVLPSLDGKKTYALSQFRGKKVLLVQFASW